MTVKELVESALEELRKETVKTDGDTEVVIGAVASMIATAVDEHEKTYHSELHAEGIRTFEET